MNFLIVTMTNDTEALSVKYALEERGHFVHLFFPADLSVPSPPPVLLKKNQQSLESPSFLEVLPNKNYEVVWWKGNIKSFVPIQNFANDDFSENKNENSAFFETMLSSIAPHAWWVNPKEALVYSGSRSLQINTASKLGFSIPATLITSDPQKIRLFFLENKTHGVLYKALTPSHHLAKREFLRARLFAKNSSSLTCGSNTLLQQFPGLFQQEIKKAYDLKVFCFGDHLKGVKISMQEENPNHSKKQPLQVTPYELPPLLQSKIREFMQTLKLNFACLRFIINPEGELFFISLKENSSFFWLDALNPELRLLDLFLQFLLAKNSRVRTMPKKPKTQACDYLTLISNNQKVQFGYLPNNYNINHSSKECRLLWNNLFQIRRDEDSV